MSWFLIALLGYSLLAVVFVLDKFILTKSVSKPIVYTFYSTIFMFGALILLPFGAELLRGWDWLWATMSGLGFGFGLWAMYTAVKLGEASHINPFIGAIITVCTFLLSSILLAERLNSMQLAGMLVLIGASFLLSLEKSKRFEGFHVGFLWATLAGMLFAVSHVSAKYIYDHYDFLTGFTWTRATTGIVGLLVLASPAVWKSFAKKHMPKKKQSYAKRHVLGIVVVDKVLGVAGVVFIQYAIAIGSVTLVNAMSGLQYAIMFVLIVLLTKCCSNVFHEYITRREFVVETLALALVVIGSALFVL